MPRVVLPGLERVKRSKVWKDLPYIIFIVVLLVSTSIGVAYFHGVDVTRAKDFSRKYTRDWFIRNNQSSKPPSIFDYIEFNPPENVPEKDIISRYNLTRVHFIVEGRVPVMAWRLHVFDYYETGSGWTWSEEDFEMYYGEGRGDLRFRVTKPPESFSASSEISLVSLWQIDYGVEALNFRPITNVSRIVFAPRLSTDNEILEVYVSAERGFEVGVEYTVFGSQVDELSVASSSSTLRDLKVFLEENPQLNKFLQIPDGYFTLYPEVKEVVDGLPISQDMRIYDIVSLLITFFLTNYNVTIGAPETEEDPVATFIRDGGGSFILYVYTLAFVLRALSIPSRIVIGYIGGYYNATEGNTYLRVDDMFLWIEVFDPGVGGWVPYNCFPSYLDVLNLVDTSFSVYVYVDAPRYVQNIPAVYLDENFTIYFVIEGSSVYLLTGYVDFIDQNESELLGSSPLRVVSSDRAIASLTMSFEVFYNKLGREPRYGIHLIIVRYKQFQLYVVIALMRRVSITP